MTKHCKRCNTQHKTPKSKTACYNRWKDSLSGHKKLYKKKVIIDNDGKDKIIQQQQ